MSNVNQLAVSVQGLSYLQETHATDLYVNRINPDGATLGIGGVGGLVIDASFQPVPALPAYTGIVSNGSEGILLGNGMISNVYMGWDGQQLFPTVTNSVTIGNANYTWSNLYVGGINPQGVNTTIGGITGITIKVKRGFGPGNEPNDSNYGSIIEANNNKRIVLRSTFQPDGSGGTPYDIFWNGKSLFPYSPTTSNLPPAGGFSLGEEHAWENLYVNNIYAAATSMNLYTGGSTSTPSLTVSSNYILPGNNTQNFGSYVYPWNAVWAAQINPSTLQNPNIIEVIIVDTSGVAPLSGSGTFSTGVYRIQMTGGGGAGSIAFSGSGGGGGSAAYVDISVNVTSPISYSYVIGEGDTYNYGAVPRYASSSTVTINSITYTAGGGQTPGYVGNSGGYGGTLSPSLPLPSSNGNPGQTGGQQIVLGGAGGISLFPNSTYGAGGRGSGVSQGLNPGIPGTSGANGSIRIIKLIPGVPPVTNITVKNYLYGNTQIQNSLYFGALNPITTAPSIIGSTESITITSGGAETYQLRVGSSGIYAIDPLGGVHPLYV